MCKHNTQKYKLKDLKCKNALSDSVKKSFKKFQDQMQMTTQSYSILPCK